MNTDRNQQLISRIALYDDGIAYRELFLFYYKRLVSFSSSITKSKESAEEVVSDVFMKLWIHRNTLLRIDNFHLYIYIITKNLSINRFLKDHKKQTFSVDDTVTDLESVGPGADSSLLASEVNQRIRESVNSMPPRCRLIFKLIKEDGLSYRETAELLDISSKTVENQMTIALRKLGEALQSYLPNTSLN